MDKKNSLRTDLPHLLIIEDSLVEQRIYVEYLHHLRCRIQIASTGEEALNKLRHESFNLILSDIGLPNISGLQVCKQLRQLESKQHKHTPMIAMSAYGDSVKQACDQAGFDDFLEKPFSFERLESVLGQWVQKFQGNTTKS